MLLPCFTFTKPCDNMTRMDGIHYGFCCSGTVLFFLESPIHPGMKVVIYMKVGFIGAGRVGFALGKYFREHGVEVAGYYSRNIQSAQEAADFTASEAYASPEAVLEACEMLFLTVPDGAITRIYRGLCQQSIRGKIFCHASGAMTAGEAFPDIEAHGACGYAVHPFFAVSDKYHSYSELADVFFTLEGSKPRLAAMLAWLQKTGLRVQTIQASCKPKYHAAASIVCNQVAALFAEAQDLLMECGFDAETAMAALKNIFLGNASHIAQVGAVKALTGPVQRCDTTTVARHLSVLGNPHDRLLYILLSERLVEVAKKGKSDYDERAMRELLEGEYAKIIAGEYASLASDQK